MNKWNLFQLLRIVWGMWARSSGWPRTRTWCSSVRCPGPSTPTSPSTGSSRPAMPGVTTPRSTLPRTTSHTGATHPFSDFPHRGRHFIVSFHYHYFEIVVRCLTLWWSFYYAHFDLVKVHNIEQNVKMHGTIKTLPDIKIAIICLMVSLNSSKVSIEVWGLLKYESNFQSMQLYS